MAPKRSLPEQFMQPPRKCRRTVNYAARQNNSDEEPSTDHDSDDYIPASDKDTTSNYEDKSDNGYGSESEGSDKDSSSEAEYQPNLGHKGARPPTKSAARDVHHPTTPAKRILRAVSKTPSAARKDSGIYDSTPSQTTPSRSRPRGTPTLAEQRPWVPLSQQPSRPSRGSPENKPWVPLFSNGPVYDYENEANPDDDGVAGEAGENDSDDDTDDDYDDNDDGDDETMTRSRLDPMSLLRKCNYSIMDSRNPYSPANFRSCMEGLPEDESSDENGGKTTRTKKGGTGAMHDEDFNSDSESESSEYTGEDEATDDRDQEDM